MARRETRNGTWGQIIQMSVNFAESMKLILKEMGSHRKLHASETIRFALSCDPESNLEMEAEGPVESLLD